MPSRCYSTQYVRWWQRSEVIQVAIDAIEERRRRRMMEAIHHAAYSGESVKSGSHGDDHRVIL